VIEDVTGGLNVAAHTVFIISQSHSVEFCVKPAIVCKWLTCTHALRGMYHPGLKSENTKNSINFISHLQLQYKLCGLNILYITLTIHLHAEVTIVIWNLRQSVSCDVLDQEFSKFSCHRATKAIIATVRGPDILRRMMVTA